MTTTSEISHEKKHHSNNYTIEVITNSLNKDKACKSRTHAIECVQKIVSNFSFIPGQESTKILAIRIVETQSKREVADLYARGLNDGVFLLDFLCVENKSRQRGLGSLLLNLATEKAIEWKMKKIKLCSFDFQAPEFYEKYRFTRQAHIDKAIDNHNLIFFEKELTQNINGSLSKTFSELKDYEVQIFIAEYTHPAEFFSEKNIEIKKVYDNAISCLREYNTTYLQNESHLPRDFTVFTITAKENSSGDIVGAMCGLMVLGRAMGSIIIDTIGFKKGYQENINSHGTALFRLSSTK